MTTVTELVLSVVMVAVTVFGCVMLGGEPDLTDAVRQYIEKKTELLTCGQKE